MGPRKLKCANGVGREGARAPFVRILPARKIQNMGTSKLWCVSGMGVEGTHTFLEGEILGENMAGEFSG